MKPILLTLTIFLPLLAQETPPAAKPPRPEPTNLKILPAQGLMPIMQSFNAALGVKCNHCHATPNFASDEKQQKNTARAMIEMTKDINSKFHDDQIHVTCYTCHRGEVKPQMRAAAAPAPAQ